MAPRPVADVLSFLKVRLALAVAASALLGQWLCGPVRPSAAAQLFAAVLALAAGAGGLNNWQDRRRDAVLARTRSRPLPSARLSPFPALLLALGMLTGGLALLAWGPFARLTAATAGLAVLCYNGLYTPLKARSLFALVPGVVCGALPPLIGWLAAGGDFRAPSVWALMTVFGLWQPPHLWLIQVAHGADYREAPLPSLLRLFTSPQFNRVLFVWIAALSLALLALPLTMPRPMPLLAALTLTASMFLTALAAYQCFMRPVPNHTALAAGMNSTIVLTLTLTALCS